MAFTALQNAAIKRFAKQGFSGTSLSEIAADVGIKPPSIYAHFKGKDELFLSLVEPTIEEELSYVKKTFDSGVYQEEQLEAFLRSIEKRFEKSFILPFLLHCFYLRPQQLARQVDRPIQGYMADLDKIMISFFKRLNPGRMEPEILAEAYMGIVDSLQAEILYGGKKRFRKRLEGLWTVFHMALN